MTLEPGDIVSTGTPAGRRQRPASPRVWLKPGDEIVISSPTLGRLETTDRAESPSPRCADEQGGEHQRQEPDDVEVEPVRRAELDGDQHRRRQRGDLGRRLSRAATARPRTPSDDRCPPARSACRKSSDGARPQTLNGELREAW